jgi:hypothetical protein
MTVWGDMDYEMQPLPLDSETAERLLAGRVAPEDAPPGYGPVVRLLDAASSEAGADELEHESEGVVAFALAVRSSELAHSVSPRRSAMPLTLSRARLVAAALAAALVTTTGLASAGSLPGAAQDVASEMLAKLGVSVPGPNDHAGTRPDGLGSSGAASAAPSGEGKGSEISELARTTDARGVEEGAVVSTAASEGKSQAGQHGSAAIAPNAPATAGKGGEISELATTTEATGVEKGAVISTAASEGKSQAGQHGSASRAGTASASTTAANRGGSGTADTASGGKSSQGTSTANAASGGRSAAGAGNAASGQSQRPRDQQP